MLRLGVTGGIGMGKSTAAEILTRLGVPVVDTDVVAREVVAPGQPALDEIRDAFGSEPIRSDGSLDRKRLAEIVFGNTAARLRLESIVHPRIREAWQRQLRDWSASGHSRGAVVIPLLHETEAESHFDAVICLACTGATQRHRLRARGWSDAQIDARMAAQLPIEEKIERSSHVIWTELPLEAHADQWRIVLGRLPPR